MNLSTFQIKTDNPWNSMDQEAEKDFQDKRDQQVKNWRNVIYKDIELSPEYSGDVAKIPDDHFEHGKIDGKETEKSYYCDTCGAMLDTKGKCYYCNEIDKRDGDEKKADKK